MKINRQYMIYGLMGLATSLAGCSESFLEVESKNDETIETYFTTDEHVQEAVVAAYDPLHWTDWGQGQYNPVCLMSDIMADDIWVGGADKSDNQFWHLMMNYEATPTNCMTALWTDAYSGVKRCNDVLTYIGWAGDNLTTANATYYEAQARVLRVMYYSWLWKFWGNIPYYEENLTSPYIAEQLTADEVYSYIIADLEGTIALDVLPMKESSSNYGRITKAVAYMLYAEIVMYQNDESRYSKALSYMQEIINSGQYSLVADYGSIFKESGEWGSESIFEVIYKDDNAYRSWSSPLVAGGTVVPRLISPSGWADGTDGHDNGWGFCPVRQETYDRYANNDARRDATCWNAAAVGSYNARYQDTGFFLEKYAAHTGDNADQIADADLNYNNNLRIYRYSETLLNRRTAGTHGWFYGHSQDLPQPGAQPCRTDHRAGCKHRQHHRGTPPGVRGRRQALLGPDPQRQGSQRAHSRPVWLSHQLLDEQQEVPAHPAERNRCRTGHLDSEQLLILNPYQI
jgi:hypothetical protein